MSLANPTFGERLERAFRRRPTPHAKNTKAVYEELLYLSSKTQSLDELLRTFPERVCAALELSSFHIFLREGQEYVLRRVTPAAGPRVSIAASSPIVLRMKRDRKPATVLADGSDGERDGWQLLATPEELKVLAEVKAQVLAPLEGRTGLMGFATLGRAGGRGFSEAEMQFLRELGPEMGRGLETAKLIQAVSEQEVERARVNRELELAREVQEGLLPREIAPVPGVEVATCYRSAAEVGGDYFDVFPVVGGVCLVVADVSGKGVSAALLMAALRAALHALVEQPGLSVTALAGQLNGLLYRGSSPNRYATLFLSVYDPTTRRLLYVNAGHNAPLVLRAGGEVERLVCGGAVVGLLPGVEYASGTVQLEAGDMLAAFTDGVTEATNARLEEWGEQRLEQALKGHGGDAPSTVARVMAALTGFTDGSPQNDDITLVVLRVL